MEEEKLDVTVDPSTTEEEVTPEGEITETPQSESGSEDLNETEVPEVDERGVPVQNVHGEFQRKYGKLQEQVDSLYGALPSMIENSMSKVVGQNNQQTKPQYTKEELIRFKNETDDASYRSWAEIELEKMRQDETRKSFEDYSKEERNKQRLQYEQQSSQREVQRLFPMMFDSGGSWNQSHELTQRVARVYNSSNKFKDDGQGLLAAAKIAFADYAMEKQPYMEKQNKVAKSTIKKLEKATMPEGGGVSNVPQGKTEIQLLQEQFERSGRTEDLQKVLKAKYLASNS